MKFTDFFIKRPVFACTISLFIFLIGFVAYHELPLRLFPKVDASVISIQTVYAGASAELMEDFVTTPIENSISNVEGIDYIKSSSGFGWSGISVHMKVGYDIDKAANDIANKVHETRWILPNNIHDPVISKSDPDGEAMMWIGVNSDTLTNEQITDYLTRTVKPQLEILPGVGQSNVIGGHTYAMKIWLDPELMAAHHVTAIDVEKTLVANNIPSIAGRIEASEGKYTVYSTTNLKTPEQFNNLVVRQENGRAIRIKNIGKAELGTQDIQFSVKINGKKAVFLNIVPKANANPLTISKDVRTRLAQLQGNLPEGMHMALFWDAANDIKNSLKEVKHTILEAGIFVVLIIFIMLGSLRAVFVPVITIPLALVGACSFMLALGYSLNLLTLLAFVLAIGLVVDDSIVVLENIHRHMLQGLPAKEAALTGAREIAFAIIAMTLTLAAVYAPIGFTKGLTGKLFIEFAFTLASAMILSGIIALTLSPMLCSKIYKNAQHLHGGLADIADNFFARLQMHYQKYLTITLKHWHIVVILALTVYGSCYALYAFTPKELAPNEDNSFLIAIASGPASANLKYTEKHTQKFEKIFNSVPEIEHHAIINGMQGANTALALLLLKPWDQRTRSADEVSQALFPLLWSLPGLNTFAVNPPTLPGAGSFMPIMIVLKTTESYEKLLQDAGPFMKAMRDFKGLQNVDMDLKIDQPQTVIDINRDIAADLGVPMSDIAQTLNIFLGSPTITRFDREGRSYDVIPSLYEQYRDTPDALNNLTVRTLSQKLVPLSNLVSIKEAIIPRSLHHFQQMRAMTIQANLAPGVTQGMALEHLEKLAEKLLPKNIQMDYAGQSRQYIQSAGKMAQIFLLALLFIYLILAAQFESFRDPFIVMLSVPLSLAGALLLLFLTHSTINIYTEIGLITLIGLITKNGILIVEFANQQQLKGLNIHDAVIKSASLRLRPILMTTMAMLLSALPLALATGESAASRQQLGFVILGGMSIGTLFTLFVVPTAYALFASRKKGK